MAKEPALTTDYKAVPFQANHIRFDPNVMAQTESNELRGHSAASHAGTKSGASRVPQDKQNPVKKDYEIDDEVIVSASSNGRVSEAKGVVKAEREDKEHGWMYEVEGEAEDGKRGKLKNADGGTWFKEEDMKEDRDARPRQNS